MPDGEAMNRPVFEVLVTDDLFPLPVAWDGRTIQWSLQAPFEGLMFICPPPKDPDRCVECHSTRGVRTYRGMIIPNPGDSHDGDVIRSVYRGGQIVGIHEQIPDSPVIGLILWRCIDCLHDVVWELATGTQWDLGPEDYGPEGSVAP